MANQEGTKRANLPGEEGYPPPQLIENLPEGSVISPLGVTRPPDEILMDPYRKERSKDPQLAGKVLLHGKTHHGFVYERIVEVNQPRTEKGMFQWFKAHFPDAVDEDFSAKAVSDEEAEKLEKEWTKEQLGKQHEERDRRAQAQTASNSRRAQKSQAQAQEDWDSYTVAELKQHATDRNVEAKHDWTKDDYVKALKKGK